MSGCISLGDARAWVTATWVYDYVVVNLERRLPTGVAERFAAGLPPHLRYVDLDDAPPRDLARIEEEASRLWHLQLGLRGGGMHDPSFWPTLMHSLTELINLLRDDSRMALPRVEVPEGVALGWRLGPGAELAAATLAAPPRKLRPFGFFRELGLDVDDGTSIRDFLGAPPSERDAAASYLSKGISLLIGFTSHFDVLDADRERVAGGHDSVCTDTVWIWPAVLEHYVRKHGVRVPDEFLQRMRDRDWVPPQEIWEPFEYPWPGFPTTSH